jgi:hypothetical protein
MDMIEDTMTYYPERIVMAFVIISLSLLIIPASHAQIIEQNPWDNLTRPGWQYTSGSQFIDGSANTPNPPTALRYTYPEGMPGGVGPGTAEYPLGANSATEIYYGYWFKWSPNFEWHGAGTKMSFLWTSENGLMHDMIAGGLVCGGGDCSPQKFVLRVQNSLCQESVVGGNIGTSPIIETGQWYWLEVRAVMNTPGQGNGIVEAWINGVKIMSYNDRCFTQNAGVKFYDFMHSATWGGLGCCKTQTDYLWFDQTTISHAPIGMPGSPPSDTTPPAPPLNLTAR